MDEFFLLIGQSNMAGRGEMDNLADEFLQPQGILQFLNNQWQPVREPMQPADDPIFSVNADKVGGIGPGVTFAKEMQSKINKDIGLLLCAKGGNGIEAWEIKGDLYQETVKRTHQAQGVSRLRGILIHVGEGDTHSFEAADNWLERFYLLVNSLRSEFGMDLPVVFAQIATVSESRRARKAHGFVAWDYLKNVQASVCMVNVAMVKTEDLPLKQDGIHLSTAAQMILGERFARSMLRLMGKDNLN